MTSTGDLPAQAASQQTRGAPWRIGAADAGPRPTREPRILRLCSVFEPPDAVLDDPRGVRFDPIGGMQNHTAQLTRALDRVGVGQTVITARPPGAR